MNKHLWLIGSNTKEGNALIVDLECLPQENVSTPGLSRYMKALQASLACFQLSQLVQVVTVWTNIHKQ